MQDGVRASTLKLDSAYKVAEYHTPTDASDPASLSEPCDGRLALLGSFLLTGI